jgi:hypothetical protein
VAAGFGVALFGSSGKDLGQQAAPPDAACAVHAQQVSLTPGSSATLLETQSSGLRKLPDFCVVVEGSCLFNVMLCRWRVTLLKMLVHLLHHQFEGQRPKLFIRHELVRYRFVPFHP